MLIRISHNNNNNRVGYINNVVLYKKKITKIKRFCLKDVVASICINVSFRYRMTIITFSPYQDSQLLFVGVSFQNNIEAKFKIIYTIKLLQVRHF